MFARQVGAYPSEAPFTTHKQAPTNIRLGWKGLPGANNLSFLPMFKNYGHGSFSKYY